MFIVNIHPTFFLTIATSFKQRASYTFCLFTCHAKGYRLIETLFGIKSFTIDTRTDLIFIIHALFKCHHRITQLLFRSVVFAHFLVPFIFRQACIQCKCIHIIAWSQIWLTVFAAVASGVSLIIFLH